MKQPGRFLRYLILSMAFQVVYLTVLAGRQPAASLAGDTLIIRALFEKGNQFIDGPPDSLISYYNQALELIDRNLQLTADADTPGELVQKYLRYKYRASLEIGIEKFFQGKYAEAQDFNFRALELAIQLDNLGLQSETYGAIGIVYKNQGEYDKALEYYEKALETAILASDTAWIAACYANSGNVYRRLANYTKALDYFLKAQVVFEKSGEKRRIAIGWMNIGNLYEDQKDFSTALEYYSKALQLSFETGDQKRIAECLMNIGNIYSDRGDYALARDYYDQSRRIYESEGYHHALDDCYKFIGNTYEREGEFEMAITFYNLALDIVESENDKITRSEVMGNLARIYLQHKSFEKAMELALESLSIAEGTGDLHNTRNAFQYLSLACEGLQRYQDALVYERKYSLYNDSIFNAEKYKSIKDLELKYETQQKEQQLALLEEKNQVQVLMLSRRYRLFITSLIITGLILGLGYILVRNRQLRSRHRAIELEQALMRSQMNPHFIFNSLIAIQSYIYKEEPVKAGDFLAKFADLVRITLENTRAEFVLFDKELRMIQAYLDLQSLRYDGKFQHTITVDESIDPSTLLIPPMMSQPFIENAIEHGLRYKVSGGKLSIRFSSSGRQLQCLVEDNGIGRKKAAELESGRDHQPMATRITRERLTILGRKFKTQFEFRIEDLVDPTGQPGGTKVLLSIPCLETDSGTDELPGNMD